MNFLLLAASLAASQEIVALDSKSPLVQVKIIVKGGSAADPAGKEGTAFLLGQLLVEGGFGDPAAPVTKERLAELTRPWGSRAFPSVSVSKEIIVLSAEVPREVFARYAETVLGPMLSRPLFASKELERLRGETLQSLTSGLRLERLEELGLTGLDALLYDGEPYGRPDVGTENGLKAVTRDDAAGFHKKRFVTGNMIVGLSTSDSSVTAALKKALSPLEGAPTAEEPVSGKQGKGRKLLIVSIPNAASSGIHAGHKIEVTRSHPDFWPLYVGNIWFGTHRDGFSHLYVALREQRGYNYGDYSYIEHFEGRPYNLFPPFNTPRRSQYFSIWVRPVAHAYVPHILKAITWELEELLRAGLSERQCAEARNKAKVLYLSLAETSERLLASRLDDRFYGLEPGYLPSYLKNVESVSCEAINAALRRHLRPADLQYLVTTSADSAAKLADDVASGAPAWGKGPADYQIDVKEEDGKKLFLVPEPKLDVLRLDAVWANHPLGIGGESIRIVPVERLFADSGLPQ
jgi:zinc protease